MENYLTFGGKKLYCNNCGTNIGDSKFCPSCGAEAMKNNSNSQTDKQNAERILEDLTLNDVLFPDGHSFSYNDNGAVFEYIGIEPNFGTDKKFDLFKIGPIFFVILIFCFILLGLLLVFGGDLSCIVSLVSIGIFAFIFSIFAVIFYTIMKSALSREHLTISVTPNEVKVYNLKEENLVHLSKDDIYQFYFVKKVYTSSSNSTSDSLIYRYKLFIKTVKDVLIGKEKKKSTNKIDLGIQMTNPKEVRFLEQEFEKILGIPDRPVEDEFEFSKKQYTTIKNNLNGQELPKPEFTKNLYILKDDDQEFFLKREFNFLLFKKISSFLVDGKTLKISDSNIIGKEPNKEKQINLDFNSQAIAEEQERDGKTVYYYQNKDRGISSFGFSTSGDPSFIRIYCVKLYPNVNNRFDYTVLMHSLTFEEAEYISFRINRLLERNVK